MKIRIRGKILSLLFICYISKWEKALKSDGILKRGVANIFPFSKIKLEVENE